MNKIIAFIFISLLNICYGQNPKLDGKWICDKITYFDNSPIEINNPQFSVFLSYEFDNNKCYISGDYTERGLKTDYSILSNKIKFGFRSLTFEFQGDYLILTEDGDDKKFFFLKEKYFISKNSFYDEKFTINNGDTLCFQSLTNNPKFINEHSFSDFMRKNVKSYSKYVTDRHLFKSTFVLTKENQIKDVNITNSISKTFDNDFIEALNQSKPFWKNDTGKDIIIEHSFYFFKQGQCYFLEEEKKFEKFFKEGNKHYEKNDFLNAIKSYENILVLEQNKLEFMRSCSTEFKLKLGISYLATNQIEKACEIFKLVGDEYNFKSRNFLINFCK
jgi:hypothetical protein